MSDTLQKLDMFYAGALGCAPSALRSKALTVVELPRIEVTFAKGHPLALYGVDTGEGTVVAVRCQLAGALREALTRAPSPTLQDPTCDVLQGLLTPLVQSADWFRGLRMYCDASSFVDRRLGVVEAVTHTDPKARELHEKWGGEVFGQVVEGRVVSWAAEKPLSDTVCDLRVDTLPEHRGKGCAASVVSAAVAHILDSGRIAGWGTDRVNTASLRTAQAVGFTHYALDFGCIAPEAQ